MPHVNYAVAALQDRLHHLTQCLAQGITHHHHVRSADSPVSYNDGSLKLPRFIGPTITNDGAPAASWAKGVLLNTETDENFELETLDEVEVVEAAPRYHHRGIHYLTVANVFICVWVLGRYMQTMMYR